jgi:hypothetical protein
MRILIRLLSCVVIVSAAITVWTRAALVFALGPRLASACLWIAGGRQPMRGHHACLHEETEQAAAQAAGTARRTGRAR